MRTKPLLAACSLLSLVLPPLAAAAKVGAEMRLLVDGKSTQVDKLPPSVGAQVLTTIEQLRPFLEKHDLTADTDAHGTYLLLAPEKLLGAYKLGDKVREGNKRFREAFGLGEDWPGGAIAEVVVLESTAQYQDLLDLLASRYDYLAAWRATANDLYGFTLPKPLITCIVKETQAKNEQRLDNQVVHQLQTLNLMRTYGDLPYALNEGISWYLEDEQFGGIYAFSYRSGFVSVREHSSWWKTAQREAKKADGLAKLDSVLAMSNQEYVPELALGAYALAKFLIEKRRDDGVRFLEQVKAKVIEVRERDPAARATAELATPLFHAVFGADADAAFREFVKKGK